VNDSFLAWASTIQKVTLAWSELLVLSELHNMDWAKRSYRNESMIMKLHIQAIFHQVTVLQKYHRIIWAGRDLWRVSGQPFLSHIHATTKLKPRTMMWCCCQRCSPLKHSLLKCASRVSCTRYLRRSSLRIVQLQKRKVRLDDTNKPVTLSLCCQ